MGHVSSLSFGALSHKSVGSGLGERRLTLLRMISGARYSGVPHSVQVRPFTRLAKPKSVTLEDEIGKEGSRRGGRHFRKRIKVPYVFFSPQTSVRVSAVTALGDITKGQFTQLRVSGTRDGAL